MALHLNCRDHSTLDSRNDDFDRVDDHLAGESLVADIVAGLQNEYPVIRGCSPGSGSKIDFGIPFEHDDRHGLTTFDDIGGSFDHCRCQTVIWR